MTTNGDGRPAPPAVVRRLRLGRGGQRWRTCVEIFEDLQTVLRLLRAAGDRAGGAPTPESDPVVEAVWTTALLSYARCFAPRATGAALTEDDLTAAQPETATCWSGTRCCCGCATTTPTRASTRGSGSPSAWRRTRTAAPSGVAITSVRQPLVDDLTVRQTGAIATR